MQQIVGFVGEFASGKSSAAKYFQQEFGFQILSLSGKLRQIYAEQGILEPTRAQLQDLGNRMRAEYGGGILVEWALDSLTHDNCSSQGYILDAPRNPAEVYEIKKHGGFVVAVLADTEIRATRFLQMRQRIGDPTTREEFDRLDRRDKGEGEASTGQQVAECIRLADYKIDNNLLDDPVHLARECDRTFVTLTREGIKRQAER